MDAIKNHPSFKIALILWAALLQSCFVYVFLGWFLTKERNPLEMIAFTDHSQSHILGLVSVVILAIGFFVSHRIVDYNRHFVPKLPAAQQVPQAVSAFMVPFILRMAVCEAVGLLGFVITLNTGDVRAAILFCGIAVCLQLTLIPTPTRIASWAGLKDNTVPQPR